MRYGKLFQLALTAVWFVAVTGHAAETSPDVLAEIAKENAECFACHSDAGIKSPPRADLDLVKLGKLLIDGPHYDASNHTGIACTQCHGKQVSEWPHPVDTRDSIAPCEECHASKVMRVERQIEKSAHGVSMAEPLTCIGCHKPHRGAIASRQKNARVTALQDNKTCLDCHQSQREMARVSGDDKLRPDMDEAHDWLPNTRLHWQAVRCLECHTESDKKPHEITKGEDAERQCIACHSANSSLQTRLYRHQAQVAQEKYGFLNSAVLSTAYVVGATRHPLLDRAIIGMAALTVLGILGHGALRILLAIRRRKHRRLDKADKEAGHD